MDERGAWVDVILYFECVKIPVYPTIIAAITLSSLLLVELGLRGKAVVYATLLLAGVEVPNLSIGGGEEKRGILEHSWSWASSSSLIPE